MNLGPLLKDPYWPKWDGPWWHMTLLWELGRGSEIPAEACRAMLASLRRGIKPFFLSSEAAGPVDPRRELMCHCGWGTIYQVLRAAGVDVEKELPGVRPWLLRYQLPDGGLNCEEEAYAGSRKSSIVSTVPALEAMLGSPGLSREEESFLDRGAEYLLRRRLVRSSSGKVLNPAWLKPYFPRFYDYDELRGLAFIVRWSRRRGLPLPAEVGESVERQRRPGPPGRPDWLGIGTLRFERGEWLRRKKAASFPELDAARRDAPRHLARLRAELDL